MSRRKKRVEREIQPDPQYNSKQVAKFIDYVMQRGKKETAQRIVYDAFDMIKNKSKADPLKVFSEAIRNVSPLLEVRSRRVGGASYQIPFPVKGDRKFTLSSKWIIEAARFKKGKRMAENLFQELIDASKNQGRAIKKKEDTHRMAEANKAFAHFARFAR